VDREFSCTKIFRFCCAHQLVNTSTEKCKSQHGHSYKLEVTVACNFLINEMVIDFTILKNIVTPFIESVDHKMLSPNSNHVIFQEGNNGFYENHIFPIIQPTAESIVEIAFNSISKQIEKFDEEETKFSGSMRRRTWLKRIKLWEEIDSAFVEIEAK